MAGLPGFESTGEVFLPGLPQLSHDVGMLRGEPILKLVEGLHRFEDGRGNFESSGFHNGVNGSTELGIHLGRRGAADGGLRLPCALALDVAGGGPFADEGGVAFEEVVHEGVEAFAEAHAGGDE